jgi:hypothetical protein
MRDSGKLDGVEIFHREKKISLFSVALLLLDRVGT